MASLIGAGEPAAYELVNADGRSRLLLVCDHASNRVPASLGVLGLSEEQLASHIGWDPGAAAVARLLSESLDAPLLLSNYSRLVIDCNRWPDHPESIPQSSAGIAIPGNTGLSPADALQRRRSLLDPYHNAIAAFLEKPHENRFLLSIHSFTPSLFGSDRPWPIGVCYREDSTWAKRWIEVLAGKVSQPIGDNQPYEVEADVDYTIPAQAEARGIPGIMLELRQDSIGDEAGIRMWSNTIAESWLAVSGIQTP